MIKPDGVMRGLVGEIIGRFEQRGLKVIALDMFQPEVGDVDTHYPKDAAWLKRLGNKTITTYEKYGFDPIADFGTDNPEDLGPEIRKWLMDYLTMGPMVKMVVEGTHAVDMVRKIVGSTLPYQADMGTIRGDYSNDSPAVANVEKRAVYNLIHASETPEEAAHEIEHWFGEAPIHSYKRHGE